MKYLLKLGLAVLAAYASQSADASNLLVTPQWVAEQQGNEALVLLHVGDLDDFEDGHIAGAQHVDAHMDLSDPSSHHGDALVLELPSADQLHGKLVDLGVTDASTIVIYWQGDEITNATRAWFTLHWAGLGARTKLLDGGLDAWSAAGYPLSREVTAAKRGALTLSPNDALVVDADWVQAHSKDAGYHLLDARSRAHYDGVSRSGGKSGHIPGAGSVPWTELVDHDLKFRDSDALASVLSDAGVVEGDTVVVYCHIGQYATAVMLAAKLLGHEAKLYDGAFQDWARRDLPVVTEG